MGLFYATPTTYDKARKDFPDSSNVERAEYQLGPDPYLVVVFRKSGAYRYDGVPVEVWLELLKADSPGKFVHANLRDRYPTTKVEL